MSCTMAIFELTKTFPADEKFSLVDQVRRSSRSVCANLAEGWRKRRYEAAFIAKLSDAEGEAGETIVWLEIARRCGYVSAQEAARLAEEYDHIIAQLITMSRNPSRWIL